MLVEFHLLRTEQFSADTTQPISHPCFKTKLRDAIVKNGVKLRKRPRMELLPTLNPRDFKQS